MLIRGLRTDEQCSFSPPTVEPAVPQATSPKFDTIACDEELRLENQLSFAIYKNANKISRLYRPSLEPLGLTFPQYLALLALYGLPACTVGDLSRALGLESNTLTPLLKRLEAAGYVTRKRDREDERLVRVTLTAKGEAFRVEAAAIRTQLIRDVGVPEDEMAKLRTTLKHLARQIDLATGDLADAQSSGATKGPAEDEEEH